MIKREFTHCLWMTCVVIALLAGSVHGGSAHVGSVHVSSAHGGGVDEPTVLPNPGVVSMLVCVC